MYQLPAASGVSPWYVKQNIRDWDFRVAYHRIGHREHRHRSEVQHQQNEATSRGLKANRRQGYWWRQNESCSIRAQCDYKAYREKLWKIIIHILSRWLRVKGYEISWKAACWMARVVVHVAEIFCTSYSPRVFKVWAGEYKTHFLKSVACHPCEIYLLRNKQAAGRSTKSVGCEPRG